MAAFARLYGSIDSLQENVERLYPGEAFNLVDKADIPQSVKDLINNNGYSVIVVEGDSYEPGLWLSVEDDFEIGEPLSDDVSEWEEYEKICSTVSDLRQKYATAFAAEVANA